jgi:L-ascorbate metabolism protein UlaG (beta-lactamase superfamily)
MSSIVRGVVAAWALSAVGGGLRAQGAPSSPRLARASRAASTATITVTWLGHATFLVTSAGGTTVLLDPWIKGNPSTPDSLKDLGRYHPSVIIVTHSHSDHSGDAKAIATASGAPVVGPDDWVETLGLPNKQALGGNVGGTFTVGDVIIHLVPAMHGSVPDGRPLGVVLEFADGRTLYDTGDTWIFGDMSLIEELYHPSIVLLGVGGGPYTEDPRVAALAIRKYFHPRVIIPMHYGTFGALAQEADVRKAFAGDSRLQVLTVGHPATF